MYNRKNLIYKISKLYYEDNKTQTEISNLMGISRPTVSKMLSEAIELGIVTISINNLSDQDLNLADKIKLKYGLQHVSIVDAKDSLFENKIDVAIKAAAFLEGKLSDYNTIGIAWGTTLYEFVKAASQINSSLTKVVPLIGGVSINDIKYHSNHLAFQLANKYKSNVSYFYAPAMAENMEVYESFIKTELVQDVLKEARNVDIAIVSTDYPLENSTFENLGYINHNQKEQLLLQGVVGGTLTSFYDKDCKIIKNPISDKMIGLGLDDLKEIDETLLVASGKNKSKSVLALLSSNYITYLFIDSDIAKDLV